VLSEVILLFTHSRLAVSCWATRNWLMKVTVYCNGCAIKWMFVNYPLCLHKTHVTGPRDLQEVDPQLWHGVQEDHTVWHLPASLQQGRLLWWRNTLRTEMEFLDINLTKSSSLLLLAIHSAFYWRILKKTILFSGFKIPYKKSWKQEKLEFVNEYKKWS
jgi:hypothetical protein